MAMTVTLNTIDGSSLDQMLSFGRVSLGAVITEIPAAANSDAAVMFLARDAVLALQGNLAAYGHPEFTFSRIVIKGFMTNGCFAQVFYETFQGTSPSAYILRYTSYITRVQTDLIPGLRTPIRVGWTGTVGGQQAIVPPDNVTMAFMMPTLGISVSGLKYGTPSSSVTNPLTGIVYGGGNQPYQDAVGSVNSVSWPSGISGITARDKGFWMLAKYENTTNRYSGVFTYEAVAICRVFADWSETGILRSHMTGRKVTVDPSIVAQMNNAAYKYGYIFPADGTNTQVGIVRIGGNPTTGFSTIFGF